MSSVLEVPRICHHFIKRTQQHLKFLLTPTTANVGIKSLTTKRHTWLQCTTGSYLQIAVQSFYHPSQCNHGHSNCHHTANPFSSHKLTQPVAKKWQRRKGTCSVPGCTGEGHKNKEHWHEGHTTRKS